MRFCGGLVSAIAIVIAGCNHDASSPPPSDLAMAMATPCTLHSVSMTIGGGCTLLTDCTGTEMREVACTAMAGGYSCDCVIDGAAASSFDSPDLCTLDFPSATLPAVNKACGWNLQ